MSIDYEPVEIDPRDRPLLERIGRLRVRAWSTAMPGVEAQYDCWLDDFELVARHWCIFHDGEPVAAARFSIHDRIEDVPDPEVYAGVFPEPLPAPIASFNRLVVHPEFRGRGFATMLDHIRMTAVRLAQCKSIIGEVHSGEVRESQLRRLGFEILPNAKPFRAGHFFSAAPPPKAVYLRC